MSDKVVVGPVDTDTLSLSVCDEIDERSHGDSFLRSAREGLQAKERFAADHCWR
jgi:hypothetical protein